MNVKNIFKILQVHVITGRYGKRLGKTDEIASTSIVKLNAKSLVASDIRMWKSMNFKWNQLLCFFVSFPFFNPMATVNNLGWGW